MRPMNKYVRRALIGLGCGLVSSVLLAAGLNNHVLGVLLAVRGVDHTQEETAQDSTTMFLACC